MCVFFTLNNSSYPSASCTPSVRADSSILERYKFWGHKTTRQRYHMSSLRTLLQLKKSSKVLRQPVLQCVFPSSSMSILLFRYIYIYILWVLLYVSLDPWTVSACPPGCAFYLFINPSRAAVPCWGQHTWNLSVLSPKRDCAPKAAKVSVLSS